MPRILMSDTSYMDMNPTSKLYFHSTIKKQKNKKCLDIIQDVALQNKA